MSQQNQAKDSDKQNGAYRNPDDLVFNAVGELSSQLQQIETFFARRFDELSMEINATSQQVDMAEEGITQRFSDVFEVLKAVSYSGDGKTPANAGVELDAVVDMTEEAANRILDAAGRISMSISSDIDWNDEEKRNTAFSSITRDIEEVFLACSFQDVTGQRIRKTLDNLREIEERLNGALDKMGIAIDVGDGPPLEAGEYAQSQDDIDALFEESKDK